LQMDSDFYRIHDLKPVSPPQRCHAKVSDRGFILQATACLP
jgi:hypothetical protein